MFAAGEIKQKLLHKFNKVFFDSPFIWFITNTAEYIHIQTDGGSES